MQDFSTNKKGYSKEEVEETISEIVDDYETKLSDQKDRIFDLRKEVESLKENLLRYKTQDQSISGALIAAVETAQEIENTSKNIYELEIKRIRELHNRWEEFLNELMLKYPEMKDSFDPQIILDGFNRAIEQVREENFDSMKVTKKANNKKARNGIQSLLTRMGTTTRGSGYGVGAETASNKAQRRSADYEAPARTVTIRRNDKPSETSIKKVQTQNSFINEGRRPNSASFATKIKPITNLTLTGEDKYESLVDKYLNTNNVESETFANSAYSKLITNKEAKKRRSSLYPTPNESGFDLKAAINPQEELTEIMKAFDFFNDDDE